MAYDIKKLEKKAIEAIKKHNIKFITYVPCYIGIAQSTFFLKKMEKIESLKKAIEANRTSAKQEMVDRWIRSDNATLQISAFKLMSDNEERKKLSQQYTEITGAQGKDLTIKVESKNDKAVIEKFIKKEKKRK